MLFSCEGLFKFINNGTWWLMWFAKYFFSILLLHHHLTPKTSSGKVKHVKMLLLFFSQVFYASRKPASNKLAASPLFFVGGGLARNYSQSFFIHRNNFHYECEWLEICMKINYLLCIYMLKTSPVVVLMHYGIRNIFGAACVCAEAKLNEFIVATYHKTIADEH